MKKIVFVAKILLLSALIVWIALRFNPETAKAVLRSADLYWGIAALLSAVIGNVFVAVRWGIIIGGAYDGRKTSVPRLFWYNLLALFYSIFLPTSIAGEAVRLYKLKHDIGGDYGRSTITVALDRIMGVATWLLLFLALPSPIGGNRQWLWLALIVPVAAVLCRKWIKIGQYKLFDFARQRPADIAKAVLVSLLSQAAYIGTNYAVFKCFGLEIDMVHTAGITATVTLAGIVPVSLLGIGLREGSMLAFLPKFGASATQAALVVSGLVFINYVLGMAGGAVELARSGWNFSRMRAEALSLKPENEEGRLHG